MTIKQEVIIDLLPLYFAGDASEETQELIEMYFEKHPKFAKAMMQMHEQIKNNVEEELGENIQVEVSPEQKLKALQRTKVLLRMRAALFLSGTLSLILPVLFMVFVKESDAVEWAKYVVTGILIVVMPTTWIGYAYLRYRMRNSGDLK
ncbi:hypothetical protein DRW07_13380 [Alteromonas sediminis]|uniref:Uncharacterized protein n=1 Tax=Alteromonas sediminis TaxID=2259342 RepID=A0A3N5XYT3_9ALTE|nr:hypothetical protein [Alteromonas sediminis]RPJ65800.1 hypothetical protein DRW07_13380 [Alteromonas sediminis]